MAPIAEAIVPRQFFADLDVADRVPADDRELRDEIAELLWEIDPDTPADEVAAIIDTAAERIRSTTAIARVLDSYGSVGLAVDLDRLLEGTPEDEIEGLRSRLLDLLDEWLGVDVVDTHRVHTGASPGLFLADHHIAPHGASTVEAKAYRELTNAFDRLQDWLYRYNDERVEFGRSK